MGMFDALRGKLKKFGRSVEEEVAKDLPPTPATPAPPPQPAKPVAKPAKAAPALPVEDDDFDEELERELAAIEAQVEAEKVAKPAPPKPAPTAPKALPNAEPVPSPKAEPRKPAPTEAKPASVAPAKTTFTPIKAPAQTPAPAVPAPPAPAPVAAPATPAPPPPPPPQAHAPPSIEAAPPKPAAPPRTLTKPPPEAAPKAAPVSPKPSGKGTGIRPERVEELLWDLELMLLESDIAVPVVEAIKERLTETLPTIRVTSTSEIQPAVEEALKDALRAVLSEQVMDFDDFVLNAKKPVKIMFVGINGTGKTTTIARIAHRLKQNGYSSVLAAGDTFRAGAIEQISIHSDRLGLSVVKHTAGADPAAVAHDAIQLAESRRKDVVLIDTAGRMQTNLNLMEEMKKIKRVSQPDLIVFIGDALAGNDAVEQAKKFDQTVGINAAILTKVDTDSKGGAALSIAHAVGKPILFLGVGQGYEDLIPFDPDWVVDRIFGE